MPYPNQSEPKPKRTRRPQPIGTFTDCHQLWQTALAHGSIVAEFPTQSAAIAMRQRMNTYRCLLRDRAAEAYPGALAESPFDHLQIALFDNPPRLAIAMRPLTSGIKITTQSGEPVPLAPFVPVPGAAPAEPLHLKRDAAADDDFEL